MYLTVLLFTCFDAEVNVSQFVSLNRTLYYSDFSITYDCSFVWRVKDGKTGKK